MAKKLNPDTALPPTRPRVRTLQRTETPAPEPEPREMAAAINAINRAHVRRDAVDAICTYLTYRVAAQDVERMKALDAEWADCMTAEGRGEPIDAAGWDRINSMENQLRELYNKAQERMETAYPPDTCAAEWVAAVRLYTLQVVEERRGYAQEILDVTGWTVEQADEVERRAHVKLLAEVDSDDQGTPYYRCGDSESERQFVYIFSAQFLRHETLQARMDAMKSLHGAAVGGIDAHTLITNITELVLRNKWTACVPEPAEPVAEPAAPVKAKRGTVAKEMFFPLDKWARTMTGPSTDRDRLYRTGVVELVTGNGLRSRATLECYDTDGTLLIPSPDLIMRYGLTGFDAAVYSALLTIVDMHERAGIPLAEYKHIPLSRIWRQMCPARHGEKARVPTKAQLQYVSGSLMKLNALRPGIACPLYVSKTGRPLGGVSFPRMVEMAPAQLEIDGRIVPGIELYRQPIGYGYTMGLKQLDRVPVGVIAELPNSYTYAGIGIRHYLLSLIVYGHWYSEREVYAPYAHLYQQAGVSDKNPQIKTRAIKTAMKMLKQWVEPTDERDAVLTGYQAGYMGEDGKGLLLALQEAAESDSNANA